MRREENWEGQSKTKRGEGGLVSEEINLFGEVGMKYKGAVRNVGVEDSGVWTDGRTDGRTDWRDYNRKYSAFTAALSVGSFR